ncbi:MAG TPA: hypothetical protein VMS40_16470 [Vicinamibacterales bacterium]|nr:hypothetical protein [Vicinamibacterales bacterium]
MKTDGLEGAILSHHARGVNDPLSAVSRGQTAKGNGRTVKSAFIAPLARARRLRYRHPSALGARDDSAHDVLTQLLNA